MITLALWLTFQQNNFNPETLISILRFDEKTVAPFLFIVQMDDETVGILSASSDIITPIERNRLPVLAQRDISRAIAKARS